MLTNKNSNEILIGVSPNPNQIYTNSKIKLYCTKNNNLMTQLNFVAQWKRVGMGSQQIITTHQNSTYECSPLDLGAFIQIKIKYQEEGVLCEQIRKLGPIKLEPEMGDALQKSISSDLLKVRIIVEKISIDLILKTNQNTLIFTSKQNCEFNMKIDLLSDLQMKSDVKMITLRLKQNADSMNKFLSIVLKKPLKKIENADMVFQSRSKRDYFIFMIKKVFFRKSNNSLMQYRKEDNFNKGRDSNNNHNLLKQRINPQAHQLTISRKKPEKRDSNKNQKPIQQNDILKDMESNFVEFVQKKQDALNLRDSFNQLQQKYLKEKMQMQQDTTKDESIDQIKNQLEQAKKQIKKLIHQNEILKEQNNILKQNLSSTDQKQISNLRNKIQYLTEENIRLQNQRTQIISEKINIEIKYQKQKQEKEVFKQKIQQFSSSPTLPRFDMKKIQFKNSNVARSPPPQQNSVFPQSPRQSTNQYSKINESNQQTSLQLSPDSKKLGMNRSNFKRIDTYIGGYRY